MNYLKVLKHEDEPNNIINIINEYQTEFGHDFPPFLKLFYTIYSVNQTENYGGRQFDKFQYAYKDKSYFGYLFYKKSSFHQQGCLIQRWFEFKYFKKVLLNYFNDDYQVYLDNYICIGETDWFFPILVGVTKNDLDKVFIYNLDEQKLELISNNIFEYCLSINIEFNNIDDLRSNQGFPKNKDYDDLFKKFGEDFWRIGE